MKIETITFVCDSPKCRERHTTTPYGNDTAAYLDLVAVGWVVDRPYTGWKHYCPAHAEKDAR